MNQPSGALIDHDEIYLRMRSGGEELQADVEDLMQTVKFPQEEKGAHSALDKSSAASFAENVTFTKEKDTSAIEEDKTDRN